MGPVEGFAQLELGAPHDHGLAVLDEVAEHLTHGEDPGAAVHQREHDDAEGGLELGVLVELV